MGTQAAQRKLESSLGAIREQDFRYAEARHLLLRAGFGGNPEQIRTLADWGAERSVNYLLDVKDIEYRDDPADEFDTEIMRPPTEAERRSYRDALSQRNEDAVARFRLERQQRQRRDRAQMRAIQKWWLTRMIETPKPLEEKMTLFWHGHFATSYRTIENSAHMHEQNRLYRHFALGNFGDLLFRVIRDPAMIAYLDNNDSRKGQPNENLARELMELFSLGVGNYSENDIKEGARALTGYTFEHNSFVFREHDHDGGSKNILGKSGPFDGDDFVTAILETRACSQYMTRKLYRFFVADLPESVSDIEPNTRRYVKALGNEFLRSRYEVRPVLEKIFLSRHFYDPRIMNEQIKSPVELVVGSVRSLNTPVRDLSILVDALNLMGQNIFLPPSVKGWDGGRSWINTSTLFVRQNILSFLLTGKKPTGYDALADQEKYDPETLLRPLAQADPGAETDPDRVIEYLLRFTIGGAPHEAQRELHKFVEGHGGVITTPIVTGLLLLITAMPEYQLC